MACKKRAYKSRAILFLFVTILCFPLLFICISRYQTATCFENITYREYTFDRTEQIAVAKGEWQNYIYVQEENKPLLIDILLTSNQLNRNLETLKFGDTNSCAVNPIVNHPDCVYELVSLSEKQPIFSLSDYTGAYQQDAIIGLIFVPLLLIGSLIITVVFFIKQKQGA